MPLQDLEEPDRRVDALIDYLKSENDPRLSEWAVEVLAEGMGVNAVILTGGPLRRLHTLAEALGYQCVYTLFHTQATVEPIVNAVMRGLRDGLTARPWGRSTSTGSKAQPGVTHRHHR